MRLFGFLYRHGRTTTILMIAAILAMAALFLYSARRDEIANTRANALNLAQLLQEQTRAVFLTTDLTLRNIKARLERSPPPPRHDAALRVYLRDLLMELPYVRALFVIGPGGFIIHDTDYPETPHVSLADRPYFLVHQRNADIGPYVGEPLLSRSVGRWFVPLSRRINRPDGTFSAVVVAAVEPGFFEHIYERLSLSENDSVALFHRDSTLIARAPAMPHLYGRKWPTGQVFREYLPRAPSGVLTGISFMDRTATIGYSTVEGFPLVVTAVLDQQFALAGWRGTAWVVGFSVLFIALLILLLAATLHRRRLEMELSQQRALMAHRLATVGQMADGVAHDFNNVLAIISASVELIRKRGPADALLQGVEEAVDRGSGLSAGLLAYAKRQEHDRRVENPNDLLRSLAFIIRKLAGQGIEVKFRYGPGVGGCLVDRSRFDASVLNIVANAAHAMPDGGTITISTDSVTKGPEDRLRPGDYAHIRIADTGSGMDGETLARAFDPFFTTKSADGGTGLGLPQVRSFMQDMGGGVRIASEPGAGTLVDLYLPCAATGGDGDNHHE
jgi:signal transduction histidine kinase